MKLKFIIAVLFLSVSSGFAQVDDVIFKSLNDEMTRSMSDLKFKSFSKPYYIEYVVNDVDYVSIRATFGGIKTNYRGNIRSLLAQVRMGDYDFGTMSGMNTSLPLDADYDSMRHAIWLVTDSAYKQSIDGYEAAKAAKKNSVADEEDSGTPSFEKVKPVIAVEKPINLKIDQAEWEARVRRWSAIFKEYPAFRDSTVNFYVRSENRYMVNSEGTKLLQPKLLLTFDVHAAASTANNSTLDPYRHIFSTSFENAPSEEAIAKEIRGIAGDLEKFEKAEEFTDTYIGPAIFTKGAAVQLFLQLLAPELSTGASGANPALDAVMGHGGGGFSERIGRKVLPTSISVIDDPTRTKYGDFELAGNYRYDDQGVEAKPLTLIENGVLKTLLATRQPTKRIRESNGRARGNGAEISNLIIEAKNGKSFDELKKQLIEECKAQGVPYGVIFRENNSTFSNLTGGSVLAYKVYVDDGREEPFRGASLQDFSVRELRDILAAGNDPYPFNLLLDSSYDGTGTPASVVAPSVLVEEVYLSKSPFRKERRRLLTAPTADKK